jgi:adenine-specific DNA-methyltransferase
MGAAWHSLLFGPPTASREGVLSSRLFCFQIPVVAVTPATNVGSRYDHLNKEELLRLLEARDQRDATRFGLVWEANEIERDKALNNDFVSLDLLPKQSVGAAPWRNLIIEGDNYDALRYLRMTFAGQVKCIFIDPPYNTGNKDFVYNDHFVSKEDSWRHSTWCEFIYQRLKIAKDLLRQDGVIFVSIDDNELFQLGQIMNRVFAEGNFVANVVWHKRVSPANDAKYFSADHDYLLCYAMSKQMWKPNRQPLNEEQLENYTNPDNDPRGAWNSSAYTCAKNADERPNLYYPIIQPKTKAEILPSRSRVWAYDKNTHALHVADDMIYWGKDGLSKSPRLKKFLSAAKPVVPRSIWEYSETGHNSEANLELRSILNDIRFSTPKPTRLIEKIIRISTGPNDLMLDFFAGSGTTAHAVQKVNAADGGRRRFILVSSTEATADEPEKNLCRDVCAERMRRVINGFTNSEGEKVAGLGGDFAYLKTTRIQPGKLLEIQHSQVWTTLQLAKLDSVLPYTDEPFHWAGNGDSAICYVPRFSKKMVAALRRKMKESAEVAVFSWQPQTLRQHVRDAHVTHFPVSETLTRWFGLNLTLTPA